MSELIDKIYEQRGNFAIIGLTGRTGSGCSTVAKMLSQSFEDLNPTKPSVNHDNVTNDDRKYNICYNFMEKNWTMASHIKVSNLILFAILLSKDLQATLQNIEGVLKSIVSKIEKDDKKRELWQKLSLFVENKEIHKSYLDVLSKYVDEAKNIYCYVIDQRYKEKDSIDIVTKIDSFFNKKLVEINKEFKAVIPLKPSSITNVDIYQFLGNYIRQKSFINDSESLIRIVNQLIKFSRYQKNEIEKVPAVVVVDALRNPYEVYYLRERYSAFYLMAINAKEEYRKRRLHELGYSKGQINDFDNVEYPPKKSLEKTYMQQNIERCTEIADIHITNDDISDPYFANLKRQLITYISLIKHPGIITPTPEERTMQIAYTAKFNSGCLSRQVGAVITDVHFSIKSLGWNNTPEGHTPCLLRDCRHLNDKTDESAYSEYELQEKKFQDKLYSIQTSKITNLQGRHAPYCFKDIYNICEGDTNQVHTRSLHAEENAFLQISKYGGQGIEGGKLFTTASPCELCAKKAYQLGIKEIYYIDLYPGISQKHIIGCGNNRPIMKLFHGAVGRAYIHLYQPMLSYKDEIYNILSIDIKELKRVPKDT